MKRVSLVLSIIVIGFLVLSSAVAPTASADAGKTRVLVQYAPGQRGAVESALRGAGSEFHYAFDDLDAFAVTLPVKALKGIQNNPNVVLVEEDAVRYPISIMPSASTDEVVPGEQTVPYGIDMVQARDVWDADRSGTVDSGAPTGAGRKICIIDSGLKTDHEDLSGVAAAGLTSNLPWNYDGFGHGTHVAGTIAAMNNALGVVGVTPGTVDLYIVRVFGDDGAWAYSSTLISAANACKTAGANIISMSLGGAKSSTTEKRGFDSLYAAGILSVAAAGNEGTSAFSYPASYASVVSVAAIDVNKVRADFSQYNSQVELAAPGVAVLSTLPYVNNSTVSADGVTVSAAPMEFSTLGTKSGVLVDGGLCTAAGAWTGKVVLCQRGDISFFDKANAVKTGGGVAAVIYNNVSGPFSGTLGEALDIVAVSVSDTAGAALLAKLGSSATVISMANTLGDSYEAWDGTSMATPHVSAVAALVWSANTSLTNVQVRNALTATAQDLGAAGRDVYYGFGLVQAKAAIESLGGGVEPPDPIEMVAGLSITKTARGKTWTPKVTIAVTANGTAVSGAVVTGRWSTSTSTVTCTTATDGTCSLSVSLSTSVTSVTFTLDNITKEGYTYTIPTPKQSISITM